MLVSVILLGIALVEILVLYHILKMTHIRVLDNYKYLLAEFQVKEIDKYLRTKPAQEAIKLSKKVLNMNKEESYDTNNKLLYNRTTKNKISRKDK